MRGYLVMMPSDRQGFLRSKIAEALVRCGIRSLVLKKTQKQAGETWEWTKNMKLASDLGGPPATEGL